MEVAEVLRGLSKFCDAKGTKRFKQLVPKTSTHLSMAKLTQLLCNYLKSLKPEEVKYLAQGIAQVLINSHDSCWWDTPS